MRERMRSHLSSGLLAGVAMSALLMITTACSSTPTKPTASTKSTAVATQVPSKQPSSTAPASAGADLSGTWSGQYSGADQGTFTLTWQQSGSNLTGTIKISDRSSGNITDGISGTVNGSSIRFGTLGGGAITYSGSVSGNSMSGQYTDPDGSGNWTATKSS